MNYRHHNMNKREHPHPLHTPPKIICLSENGITSPSMMELSENKDHTDINENVTLFQLMYMAGNVVHAVSISGICIYDSNDNKALPLVK